METKTYLYSLNVSWIKVISAGIFIPISIIPIYLFIRRGEVFWIAIVLIDIYSVMLTYNYFVKFLKPAKEGLLGLQLDNEKLEYYIEKKTVYWKEINSIETFSSRNEKGVNLILNAGNEVKITTSLLKGYDSDIYNDLLSYFQKSRINI
jgi:hypothetical protein